ncbi:TSC22 domain family protein 1 isoform X1 [Anguilla rostrata]|uniref:TSC22 domain family protein 1 isoform X1 n=1 Tax=Anguilla rostrata TaxID=7938 RepID=UPI0030CE9128
MFVSVKKIVSAFETRRQPRPLSLPPSLPQSFPSKLSPHKSPKNGSRLPSASSTSPACIHTNPSPHLSPPLSRSSSAPSSPNLRRTTCFSVSPSGTNVPPVVLRSSHPNLHLASHKMPSGLHHAPPALPNWPRHPVTPPPLPRQLKLPRGADWQREEGLGSGRAGGGVRSSWPSSRTELCSCGRQRFSEVTERSSPSSSVSCERTGQASCWESLPNPRSPGGPSVSHTQAAFGKTARGAPGDRDTSSACVNRLKTPALPSPIPLSGPMAMPRKQSQIHSPTLTRKYALTVPSQPVTDLGLKPQPYGTHSADPSAERGLATFTPIKTGVLCPPFLDSAQTQSRGLADRVETDRAPCFGSNIHQSQDRSACPSFRAQACYWSCSPIDTCDRQTQTPNNAQKDCDLTIYQTGSVGHSLTSKEVQTVNVCSAVSSAQLFSRVAQNPIQISAPSPSQTPGLNSSGTSSTADTGPNSESWAGSASFRDGQNCSSGAFQAQDHNGNKVCLPSSAVNLGSLNNTVGSRDCVVSHDLKVGTSPAASELSSSITCSHPTANPAASVTEAAVQRPFHTTASRTTLQGPMHTSIASGAAVQGPIHTTTFGAALQGPIHTTAIGSAVQPLDHTTASTAALQGPIHTSIACGSAVQGPVHTTACGSAVQGPVHTTACGSAVQLPVHTTACGSAEQLPVHTTACGSAVQLPVHTTACGSAVQGPVHTDACGSAEQGSSTTAVQGDIRGVRTPAPPKTSAPFPDGAENLLHPPEVKPPAGGPEPKEPKPVPVTLTRNSDKAFLSLLLFIHSGSSNSMIAIDNKIEQAMDLVKTHLMMAVREEVEVLREQIKELSERNAQLERENYILRALRERD